MNSTKWLYRELTKDFLVKNCICILASKSICNQVVSLKHRKSISLSVWLCEKRTRTEASNSICKINELNLFELWTVIKWWAPSTHHTVPPRPCHPCKKCQRSRMSVPCTFSSIEMRRFVRAHTNADSHLQRKRNSEITICARIQCRQFRSSALAACANANVYNYKNKYNISETTILDSVCRSRPQTILFDSNVCGWSILSLSWHKEMWNNEIDKW